jgi:hypothetical protein
MEFEEEVYGPRVYMCLNENCRELFTIGPAEIKKYQEQFRNLMSGQGSSGETPEDWANLRKAWDSGNYGD